MDEVIKATSVSKAEINRKILKYFKMSKSNEVLIYFTLEDAEHAKCKFCNKIYSRKGRTTTAMRTHVKSQHKNAFVELEADEAKIKMPSVFRTH